MQNSENILNEAKECLNCIKPTCVKGCPIYTNIPEFIKRIKENNLDSAYQILKQNNIMSEICSLVCPTELQCMGNCIKSRKGKPVNISKLELYVNKWAKENNAKNNIQIKIKNKSKVAIVGGGPAGIACAVELRKKGYDVTIFEKEEKLGGILQYQIPDFRLNKETVDSIQKELLEMSINVKFNTQFGKDITIESLKNENFSAIFLGIGTNIPNEYKITNKNCKNIIMAKDILYKYYKKEYDKKFGKTIIIGGGNVAIDAARVAKKMKAETVTIVYRRNEEEMPAIKEEVDIAKEEGVNFIFNTSVTSAKIENNKLSKAECLKTEIINGKVKTIQNSNFFILANTIVFAIGSKINEDYFKTIGIDIKNGLIIVNENGMTNIKGVFAGGDLVETKPTVCKAIATGKKAAEGIDLYLKNEI